MVTIDATQRLDPDAVMRMVKQAVMPGVPDALKQQAEHDMDAVIGRNERTAEQCIRNIETQLGMLDAMIADTRAIIEDYKRTHA